MGVYAFCPRCEEEVLVSYRQHLMSEHNEEAVIEAVMCGRCGDFLNLEKWVHLRQEPMDDEILVPTWWSRLLQWIPVSWLMLLNRLMIWLTGSYYAPETPDDLEVPETAPSFMEQVERLSGLKFDPDRDDWDDYLTRSFDIICQAPADDPACLGKADQDCSNHQLLGGDQEERGRTANV